MTGNGSTAEAGARHPCAGVRLPSVTRLDWPLKLSIIATYIWIFSKCFHACDLDGACESRSVPRRRAWRLPCDKKNARYKEVKRRLQVSANRGPWERVRGPGDCAGPSPVSFQRAPRGRCRSPATRGLASPGQGRDASTQPGGVRIKDAAHRRGKCGQQRADGAGVHEDPPLVVTYSKARRRMH